MMFRCPACGEECRTLRDLLTCHPRELRAMTDALAAKKDLGTLTAAISGVVSPKLRRAMAD